MMTTTRLDKNDIRSIIAHHFGVKSEDVMIDCYIDTVGYGMAEHEEPSVRAVVTIYNDKIKREPIYKNSFEESIANGWIYG